MSARPTTAALTLLVELGLNLGLGLALGLTALGAAALQSDSQQPMLIEADKVEVDEAQGTSLYLGQVQVDQGTTRLLANQVTVHHRKDHSIKYIIARGEPASYQQLMDGDKHEEMLAFAKRMDYDADRDELVLTGEALVIQGTDRVASERIVWDRANNRMQAGGTSRAKIVFTPGEQKNGQPKAAAPAPPKTPPPATKKGP
ncbi:lipopolysaccharide transport periplasmic protein LptA [uncultured Thiodictyon sp.]|uniref:lipopolysaccharide transport periplasmic protein LptA n=1 Tax=uncultured Thiodictyon sp. TaxID=1846217 RepID=UPI0025FBCFB8|nr:lipopolysaccharide transport periplasmic protein LptA [uncultured Thiodictyon sp.]